MHALAQAQARILTLKKFTDPSNTFYKLLMTHGSGDSNKEQLDAAVRGEAAMSVIECRRLPSL